MKNEEKQKEKSGAETQHERPGAFAGGDLPEPPPMQSEVDDDEGQESISEPSVPVAPFMTTEAERLQACPAARARRKAKGQEKSDAGQRAEVKPEQEIEDAV